MIEKTKRILPYILIMIFILIFFIQHSIFIKHDNSIPFSDSSRQLHKVLEYMRINKLAPSQIIHRDPYPPLAHFVCLLFFKLMGINVEASQYCLFFYVVIFLLALYGIGYEYGGHFSGFAVMALGASSPHILNYSRYFFLDFPQTAMSALTFYMILKTREYSSRWLSIILGITLALGFYTKWSIMFFLAVPILWFILPQIIKSWKSAVAAVLSMGLLSFYASRLYHFINMDQEFTVGEIFLNYYLFNFILPGVLAIASLLLIERLGRKKWSRKETESVSSVINFLIMSVIFVFMTTPWMLWSTRGLHEKFLLDRGNLGFQIERLICHIGTFYKCFNYIQIFIALGLISIIVLQFVRTKHKAEHMSLYSRVLLPLNLIFIFIFMSFMGGASIRYILSFVIFAAALGGWWTGWLGKARIPVTTVIIILCLVSMTGWIFIPESSDRLTEIHPISDGGTYFKFYKYPLTGRYPDKTDYRPDRLLDEIYKVAGNTRISIYWVGRELQPIEASYIQFLAHKRNLGYNIKYLNNNHDDGYSLTEGRYYIISSNNHRFINSAFERIRMNHPDSKLDYYVYDFKKKNYKVVVMIFSE
ncbi:MAG: glycosyltransferase family 39 protein [Candidatus Eremiobacteraeota bacterium]|nr:glycosyltransferase family 39 protein [Candidatus Eremiobacteraeota bacterium]